LADTLEKTDLQVGLRVFGHDQSIDREDRSKACLNSELLIPIEAASAARIRSMIPKRTAWGHTPIAYSLDKAGKDLDPLLEDSPMISLISDVLESCDRDPLKAILDLEKRGVNVRIFAIRFDLNRKESGHSSRSHRPRANASR
jgi:Ca-activated chloride channel family protein